MNTLKSFSFYFLLFSFAAQAKQNDPNPVKIVIQGEVPEMIKPKKAGLGQAFEWSFSAIGEVSPYLHLSSITEKVINNKITWSSPVKGPVILISDYLTPNLRGSYPVLGMPGDNVSVYYNNGKRYYKGKGAEKYQLQYEITRIKLNIPRPTKFNELFIRDMDEFYLLDQYFDTLLKSIIPLIDSYKSKLTPFEFNWIKRREVEILEMGRLNAFRTMISLYHSSKAVSLINLWQSVKKKPWSIWLRNQSDFDNGESPFYHYFFNNTEVYNKFRFDFTNDTIKNEPPLFKYLSYQNAKRIYKGLLRERVLTFLLDEQVITELGPNHDMTQKMLADYFVTPGFGKYKDFVRGLLANARMLRSDKGAPAFSVIDRQGNAFTNNDLKGKIALLDFWFTGCKPCTEMKKSIEQIERTLEGDTNVVFVNISVDTDREMWLKSVESKLYTTPHSINLYTGEKGRNHPMVDAYNIQGYPQLFLLDYEGTLISHPLPDPKIEENKKQLAGLIKQLSAKMNKEKIAKNYDGPYVSYKDDNIVISYIKPEDGKKAVQSEMVRAMQKHELSLNVNTDIPLKKFTVKLKNDLKDEPGIYTNVSRQFAISDIEGNFDALRELLQSNGVIDEHFNWIFGTGHLIFTGDMVDRGEQVTECLWLIYSLEEKAKSAGGYVHYILGNHEIMNLSNDIRYVHEKYKTNAGLIGMDYSELFNEKSELGRWLRTKNIIEKVGDVLYVHGGISNPVRNLKLNIEQINQLARPCYTGDIDSANKTLLTLFNSKASYDEFDMSSPFWFRYYYKSVGHEKAMPTLEQVDSTFAEFGIKRIVTGHTLVKDENGREGLKLTVHYNGKIINIDTHHAKGRSEALLIEDGKYYRVNRKGDKVLLFDKNNKPL